MSGPPAEVRVDAALARVLIDEQFPELEAAEVRPFGEGWDNAAFLVDDELVFRFPRRAVAVPLLRAECAVLPRLRDRLPLAISAPAWVGEPSARYAWPFAGYRRVPGRPAAELGLDDGARAALAAPLAEFLRALHGVDAAQGRAWGAPVDRWERLDLERRRSMARERLARATELGLIERATDWEGVLDAAPASWDARELGLVHGDFDARHLLLDDAHRPRGVIDWGDVHVGDPVLDLACVHAFLPPAARGTFRAAYGPIAPDAWQVARVRAVQSSAVVLVWAHEAGHVEVATEARSALARILA